MKKRKLLKQEAGAKRLSEKGESRSLMDCSEEENFMTIRKTWGEKETQVERGRKDMGSSSFKLQGGLWLNPRKTQSPSSDWSLEGQKVKGGTAGLTGMEAKAVPMRWYHAEC